MRIFLSLIFFIITAATVTAQDPILDEADLKRIIRKHLLSKGMTGQCVDGINFEIVLTERIKAKNGPIGLYKGKSGQIFTLAYIHQKNCRSTAPHTPAYVDIYRALVIDSKGVVLKYMADTNYDLLVIQAIREVKDMIGFSQESEDLLNAKNSFIEDNDGSFKFHCKNPECPLGIFSPNPDYKGFVFDKSKLKYVRYVDKVLVLFEKFKANVIDVPTLRIFNDEIINGSWCCGDQCAGKLNQLKINVYGNPEKADAVVIGKKVWKTMNLNVDRFRNGDTIPEAKTKEEWSRALENEQPAWCHYDNNPANGETYGKLYNWYAVKDPRGLAPEGWHIPSNKEWEQLSEIFGEMKIAGKKLKSAMGWAPIEGKNANGNNASGFEGRPGGYRNYHGFEKDHNTFYSLGSDGCWWSADGDAAGIIEDMYWTPGSGLVDRGMSGGLSGCGLSVRCVKN